MSDTIQPGGFPLRGNFCLCMAMLAMLCACPALMRAQSAAQKNSVPKTAPVPKAKAPKMPAVAGTELDRVDAIVNGSLILDSDVNQEQRFQVFEPYRNPHANLSRATAIQRLINRDLILQQETLQPQDAISDAEVEKNLNSVRRNIPACKRYDCATAAGWKKFLAANGFTEAQLIDRWRQRMQMLNFIEERFRMGIRISPAEIKTYYEKTLLPEYAKQKATAPKLEAISGRIKDVLLEQQVTSLLNDWLNSLRAQGSVVVLHPGEGAP